MAVFTTGTSFAINMNTFDPTETLIGTSASGSSTQHQVRDFSGNYENFYGSGLSSFDGVLETGTINRIESFVETVRYFNLTGVSLSADVLLDYADAGNIAGARAYMFSASDTIYGAGGNDVLNGYAGNDSIYGYGGNDTLYGGIGNDLLAGGLGIDTMYGGTGNDVFYISRAEDRIVEYANQGTDRLIASASYTLATNVSVQTLTAEANAGAINLTGNNYANFVYGNGAANVLDGGASDDDVYGLGGGDDLYGGGGADILSGGTGIDLLVGGGGADIFDFNTLSDSYRPLDGSDIVDDFFQSQDDVIDLSGIDARSGTAINEAFRFIGSLSFSGAAGELRSVRSGGVTIVSADVNGDKEADFGIELTGSILLDPDFDLVL